ncbi:hypothetical protein ACNRWW_07160 [Metabacillus sp. HB246100]|uniref:hypothetical protein n=1 Tax=Bacillus weihaiensis TaxID=1547283 RepID=UPI002357F5E6|nr:hypothetical protein [Bacillus weihaiensis]
MLQKFEQRNLLVDALFLYVYLYVRNIGISHTKQNIIVTKEKRATPVQRKKPCILVEHTEQMISSEETSYTKQLDKEC